MIDFTVTTDTGETFEIKSTTRDVLNWEKTTKGGSLKSLMDNLHMVDMYKVSYFAARRLGKFTGTQAEWESTVDLEFETETEDGSANPTQ